MPPPKRILLPRLLKSGPRRSPQEDAMLLFEDGEDAGCHRRRNTHGKDEDS